MFTRELMAGGIILALGVTVLAASLMQPESAALNDYAQHVTCQRETPASAIQHRTAVKKELVHSSPSGQRWQISCNQSKLEYQAGKDAIEQMECVTGFLHQGPLLRGFVADTARLAYGTQELIAHHVSTDDGGHADYLTLHLDRREGLAIGHIALPLAAGSIYSDWVDFSETRKEATFGGHVALTTEHGQASGHTMHVVCQERAGRLEPCEVTLSGGVQLSKGTQVALAQQAVYLPQKSELCLTAATGELVTLTDNGIPRVQAETLVIDPKTARTHGVGRVRFGLDEAETSRLKEALSRP